MTIQMYRRTPARSIARRPAIAVLFRLCSVLCAPLAGMAVGCGSSGTGTGGGFSTAAGANGGGGNGGSGGTQPTGSGGGISLTGGGGGPMKTFLYAHNDTTLYSVDAADPTLAVTKVGDFDCVGPDPGKVLRMTDIAVSKDDKLYGVSTRAVYLDMQVSGGTVACLASAVPLVAAPDFFGASFAPAGTLDPTNETLVAGGAAGTLYQINTQDGSVKLVGNFGTVPADDGHGHVYANAGKLWELSGDIVFLGNGGHAVGFATVRDCANPPMTTGCNTTDTLVEVDVAKLSSTQPTVITKSVRGQIIKAPSCKDSANASYGSIFGIAAYQGSVIGFSKVQGSGPAPLSLSLRIDNQDGTACLVADDTPLAMGGWQGAGVTTLSPIIAPH